MNEREFYDLVGKITGWDFSRVKVMSEGVEWDFYEEVLKRSNSTDILLDIGTGGGEQVLRIASSLFFLVGIELSNGMLETAQSNLRNSNVSNVRFFQMNSDQLHFPSGFFDIVSCRHAPFVSTEIAKVLKDGGIFFTQQVSEADKYKLKNAFGRGQAYGEVDGTLKEEYLKELKEAGFSKVQAFEFNAIEYYQRPEDLIFLLKHTPIIPEFGQGEKDFEILSQYIEQNQTEKGIQTNSKRFMIIANK